MGYYTYTKDPIGNFIEKDHGNNFEYSLNPEQDDWPEYCERSILTSGMGWFRCR